jgi:hypothetical protein
MSAQPHDHYPGISFEAEHALAPGAGVLQGVHQEAGRRLSEAERPRNTEQLTDAEREKKNEEQRQLLLHDFYDYAKDRYNIDPRTEDTTLEHDLALVVQGYAFSRVSIRMDKLRKKKLEDPEYNPPVIRLLDPIKINERTNHFYEHYGEDRRHRSNELQREETAFFKSARDRATAIVFDRDRRDELNPFVSKPESRQGIPRHAMYPEIRITMELQQALSNDQSAVAAKAAEVTVAIYGGVFPVNIREEEIVVLSAATEFVRQLRPRSYRPGIQEIPAKDIPEEQQAEVWRPRNVGKLEEED